MSVQVDGSGKRYVEVSTLPEECLWLTLVPSSEAGYGVESIRVQIREESGHLRQGPEVPLTSLGGCFAAIVTLLLQR